MEKSKAKNGLIIVLALLLLAAIGFIAWRFAGGREPGMEPGVVALTPTPEGQQAPDGIQVPGYPLLTASSSTGVLAVQFENPEGNPCTFQIDLVLEDTGETIYQSGLFKPGTGIRNPKLDKVPAPGSYNATIVYNTKGLEDDSPMNGAAVKTQLIVE
ncbi:hypothetical protein [Eubacterium sp. 1001713B170207_170306_E7]|uniref:hypothetical protein n=1 Tax=Eubacterium sp. 1001713B170207_170306_E7 TaxID=2787097 RepID=UPI00189C0BA8|nr:hypothetical protein [Eubacterium sp. 1001713B170207_170306_E7]